MLTCAPPLHYTQRTAAGSVIPEHSQSVFLSCTAAPGASRARPGASGARLGASGGRPGGGAEKNDIFPYNRTRMRRAVIAEKKRFFESFPL